MDLNTILTKKVEELSAEEKAFIIEHKAELSDEHKSALQSVLETPEEKTAREEKEKADAEAAATAEAKAKEDANIAAGLNADGTPKEATAPIAASEKQNAKIVQMSELEATSLREMADIGKKAIAELAEKKLSEKVTNMVFSETNKAGKIDLKQKDAVTAFMRSLSEKQTDQFVTIINNLPKVSIFGEIGDAGVVEAVAGKDATAIATQVKELSEKKIEEAKAKGKKMRYSEALNKVLTENPSLSEAYAKAGAKEE